MTDFRIGGAWIDQPVGHSISPGLKVLIGWVARPSASSTVTLTANGVACAVILEEERPDIAAEYQGCICNTWRAALDVSRVQDNHGVIVVDVKVDGQAVHRSYYRVSGVARPLTYFIHIPKSGGTSVREAMRAHADTISLAEVYDGGLISTEQFAHLSADAINDQDIVYGHFPVGLHTLHSRPFRYLAVLRQPYEMALSNYFYRKYSVRDPLFTRCKSIEQALSDLETRGYFDNLCVRLIAGCSAEEETSEAALARACRNIETMFDFVGLAESMDVTAEALSRYFGVRLNVPMVNVTPSPPERQMIDRAAFHQAVFPLVRYDLKLYAFVQQRFWRGIEGGRHALDAAATDAPTAVRGLSGPVRALAAH